MCVAASSAHTDRVFVHQQYMYLSKLPVLHLSTGHRLSIDHKQTKSTQCGLTNRRDDTRRRMAWRVASRRRHWQQSEAHAVLRPAAVAAAAATRAVDARLRALSRRSQWNLVARRPSGRRSAAGCVLSVGWTAAAGHVIRRQILECGTVWRRLVRRRRRAAADRASAARQKFLYLVGVEDGIVLRRLAAGTDRARHHRNTTTGRAVSAARRRAHGARRSLLGSSRATTARITRALVWTGPRTHRRVLSRRFRDVGDRRQRTLVHPGSAIDVFPAASTTAHRRRPGYRRSRAADRWLVP